MVDNIQKVVMQAIFDNSDSNIKSQLEKIQKAVNSSKEKIVIPIEFNKESISTDFFKKIKEIQSETEKSNNQIKLSMDVDQKRIMIVKQGFNDIALSALAAAAAGKALTGMASGFKGLGRPERLGFILKIV